MEWTVVTVIIAIVGLVGTVAVPLAKNTKAMTELSGRIDHLVYRMEQEELRLDELKEKTAQKHRVIFERLCKQQTDLKDHEGRINALEKRGDSYEGMV